MIAVDYPQWEELARMLKRTVPFGMAIVLGELCCLPASAGIDQDVEFTFSGQGVASSSDPGQFIRVGERLSIFAIKDRLSSYAIQISNECGGYCLIVEKDANAIQIFYDPANQRVEGIVSWGDGSIDMAGNRAGGSLLKAIGSTEAECDFGEHTSCKSPP